MRTAALRLAWLGLLSLALAALFATVRESGAVPPSEFAPAVPIYASILWLRLAGWLALFLSLFLSRHPVLGIGVVATCFPPLTVPAGALILAVLAVSWFRREGGTEPAPRRLPWSGLLFVFVLTVELGTLAAFLLASIESATYTAQFVPDLVSAEVHSHYRGSLPVLALLLGVEVGLASTAATALMAVALRATRRVKRGRALAASLGATLAAGLVLLLRDTLTDEITAIGLWGETLLLFGLLGAGFAALLDARTLASPSARAADTVLDWLRQAPLLLLAPSRRLLGGATCTWAAAGSAALVGLVLLTILGLALYPTVEDFRMKLFASYARLVLYLATLMLLGLTCPLSGRRAGWVAAGLLPVVVALALLFGRADSMRPETRLVAHEYSRFGSLAANSWAHRWTDPFETLGMREPSGPPAAFPHHGPGEARFLADSARLDRPPIVMVIWDAARPDRMSTYGYERDTTPNADRLARDAVIFEQAVSLASATTTAVRMMLSGCYASRYMLGTDHPPFLTKELADAGYDRFVITVTGNDHNGVSAESFRRGWDPEPGKQRFIELDYPDETRSLMDGDKVRDVIETWRRLHGAGGLNGTFTYLHLTGSHSPWPNEDAVRDYGPTVGDRYDGELAKVDRLLGLLLDALEELEAYRDCVLVLLADHGTGLEEHGRVAGFLCYEEQIRIPLLIKVPGIGPRRVAARVATIDLVPTLLDLVAPEARFRFDGRSLLSLLEGGAESLSPRPTVAFCAFWDSYTIFGPQGRWKLHHHRRRRYEALYDLLTDPGERQNLVSEKAEVAEGLRRLLDRFLWEGRSDYANPYHYRAWSGPKN